MEKSRTSAGPFIFLGIIGIVALAAILTSRRGESRNRRESNLRWRKLEQDEPASPVPLTTYENIEEIDFPDGFDPETFMPIKIRIKRKSKELK